MPPLLCSGAAYIVFWPQPSSQDLSAAGPPETNRLPCHQACAQSSSKHRKDKLFTLAQEIQSLGVHSPQQILSKQTTNLARNSIVCVLCPGTEPQHNIQKEKPFLKKNRIILKEKLTRTSNAPDFMLLSTYKIHRSTRGQKRSGQGSQAVNGTRDYVTKTELKGQASWL